MKYNMTAIKELAKGNNTVDKMFSIIDGKVVFTGYYKCRKVWSPRMSNVAEHTGLLTRNTEIKVGSKGQYTEVYWSFDNKNLKEVTEIVDAMNKWAEDDYKEYKNK